MPFLRHLGETFTLGIYKSIFDKNNKGVFFAFASESMYEYSRSQYSSGRYLPPISTIHIYGARAFFPEFVSEGRGHGVHVMDIG